MDWLGAVALAYAAIGFLFLVQNLVRFPSQWRTMDFQEAVSFACGLFLMWPLFFTLDTVRAIRQWRWEREQKWLREEDEEGI